jgi:hypothetical protein
MLENHPEAESPRLDRRADFHRAAFPADLAGARLDHAIEDLDQGRLAGPVFTQQRMDLARLDRQVDPVIREKVAVAFADPFKFDEGRPRGWYVCLHTSVSDLKVEAGSESAHE